MIRPPVLLIEGATTMACACGGGLQCHKPANVPKCLQQVFAYSLLPPLHGYNPHIMIDCSVVKLSSNGLVDPEIKFSLSV